MEEAKYLLQQIRRYCPYYELQCYQDFRSQLLAIGHHDKHLQLQFQIHR